MCRTWASRSLVIRTRLRKPSGVISFAICSKSSGCLMSCFGKGIAPFGHSVTALTDASSSVGALGELVPEHPDLLVGRADRDHPVGEPARLLRVDRPGRRDVDRDGPLRA